MWKVTIRHFLLGPLGVCVNTFKIKKYGFNRSGGRCEECNNILVCTCCRTLCFGSIWLDRDIPKKITNNLILLWENDRSRKHLHTHPRWLLPADVVPALFNAAGGQRQAEAAVSPALLPRCAIVHCSRAGVWLIAATAANSSAALRLRATRGSVHLHLLRLFAPADCHFQRNPSSSSAARIKPLLSTG